MLIEFAGCSGAGKTTQLNNVLAALSKRGRTAAASTALVAAATHTSRVSNLFWRNACLNFLLLPWLGLAIKRQARFCRFSLAQILQHGDSALGMLQRALSQLRNLGGHELLRRLHSAPEFILVDEGTIGGIHNVLVHLKQAPDGASIEAYSRLVPKPDLIIHIDTPVEVALRRTELRPDPPLRFHTLPERLRFVQFGHDAYAALGKCEAFRDSWRTIRPSDDSSPFDDRTSERIVDIILSKEAEDNGHGPSQES